MSIINLLERNSRLYPDEISLTEINPNLAEKKMVTWREYALIQAVSNVPYKREITWSVLDEKANRVANLLLSRGITKGKKAAILLMNCVEWLPLYFGIMKAGAVVVPLNFRYTADEIRYCLTLADVDVLFFGQEFIGRLESIEAFISDKIIQFFVGDSTPSFAESYNFNAVNCSSSPPKIWVEDDDEAAIYFSAASSGLPKAILLSHSSLAHSAKMEVVHHKTVHDDVFLCIAPLYHAGVMMHWLGSLYTGSKAILLNVNTPKAILDTVNSEHCSIVFLLVPWCRSILYALDQGDLKLDNYDFPQWRLTHIGAQPVPISLIKKWRQYFPQHLYDTNYGLSEAGGPGCVHLGLENFDKAGAIGVPGYGWECKIVDAFDCTVFKGCVGELCVKGPGVMRCYYKDPEATVKVLKDNWLHTGDMAVEDLKGFIYLVDRKKDVIISGGENLYPVQLEKFLIKHPSIADVSVIGLPDKNLGEIACAIIQPKEGAVLSVDDIENFCKKLPKYKRPKKTIFADLPRNASGQVDKLKLKELYGGTHLVELQIKG